MGFTYIYVLTDPNTLEILYVGQSVCPSARFVEHLKHIYGDHPKMFAIEKVKSVCADFKEIQWVKNLSRRGANLQNIHGNPYHPRNLARMSRARRDNFLRRENAHRYISPH